MNECFPHPPERSDTDHDLSDQDRMIVRRLAEANQQIVPPPDLVDRIERALKSQGVARSRSRSRWTAALSAAAAILVAVLGWLMTRTTVSPGQPAAPPGAIVRTDPPSDPQPILAPNLPPTRRPAEVRFSEESNLFGRELESSNPNITIVMLYRSAGKPAEEHENGGPL